MTKFPQQLLTTAEVAAQRGVHVTTVNRWVQSKRLPIAAKAPGLRGANLYDPADVDALFADEPVAS